MVAEESSLFTEDFNQQANPHKRCRYDKRSNNLVDPLNSYPRQHVPVKSELSELIDPYSFGPGMSDMSDAVLFKKIKAEQGTENLYWKQSGSFGSDLLDNVAWSNASSPRLDTAIAQRAPLDIYMEEHGMDEKKDDVTATEAEKRSKGRKRSISPDDTEAQDKEQRRIQHVVRDLQNFENQQKIYGKQQLKAIKDSPT